MNENECRELASKVRSFIVSIAARGLTDEWGSDLGCACAVASYTLARFLTSRGYIGTLVEGTFGGEHHCWVETVCDDEVVSVDITATQFGRKYREVEIVDPQYEDYYVISKGREAEAGLLMWPEEQQPQTYIRLINEFILQEESRC